MPAGAPPKADPTTVSFGGCDYLNLAIDRAACDTAHAVIAERGLSTTASRTTTGDTPHHRHLESDIRDVLATPDAVVVPDGFTANIAACEALATGPRPCRVAMIDERAHPSLRTAARAAGLSVVAYTHRDPTDLARRRADYPSESPVVVLTDGVFTATGDIAPAPGLLAATQPGDTLVLDDCHAFGVLGPSGRGTAHHFGLNDARIVTTSTLAKVIGAAGGFVAGPASIVGRVRTDATAYVCTTPTPPALIAAARSNLARVRALAADGGLDELRRNAARVRTGLRNLGFPITDADTPIAAFTTGPSDPALAVAFAAAGLAVPLMEYPGGPSASYFRVSVSRAHEPADIDRLLATVARFAPAASPRPARRPDTTGA